MGFGPNHVLDKGMLVEGTTAIAFGEILTAGVAEQSVVRATTANAKTVFVAQEDLNADYIATKKAVVAVRPLGVARVLSGAAIAKGDPLTNDITARAIKQTTAGGVSFGIAETAATAANQYVDVLLTPGATI